MTALKGWKWVNYSIHGSFMESQVFIDCYWESVVLIVIDDYVQFNDENNTITPLNWSCNLAFVQIFIISLRLRKRADCNKLQQVKML